MAEPIVHRDQTEPRSPAEYLRAQLSQIELKGRMLRGKEMLPAAEVRQAIGQALGALEGLEDRAALVNDLQAERDELDAELAEARGDTDPEALALWRGRYMAEAQQAAEAVYAQATERAQLVIRDARRRADGILQEAERRAAHALDAVPGGLPSPPEVAGDRIEDALRQARWLDGIRAWLRERDQAVAELLDEAERDLGEARGLVTGTNVGT